MNLICCIHFLLGLKSCSARMERSIVCTQCTWKPVDRCTHWIQYLRWPLFNFVWVYQENLECCVTIVLALGHKHPLPMEGLWLPIWRQHIFQVKWCLNKIVCLQLSTIGLNQFFSLCIRQYSLQTSGQMTIFLFEYDFTIKSGCHHPRFIFTAVWILNSNARLVVWPYTKELY